VEKKGGQKLFTGYQNHAKLFKSSYVCLCEDIIVNWPPWPIFFGRCNHSGPRTVKKNGVKDICTWFCKRSTNMR